MFKRHQTKLIVHIIKRLRTSKEAAREKMEKWKEIKPLIEISKIKQSDGKSEYEFKLKNGEGIWKSECAGECSCLKQSSPEYFIARSG